MSVESRSPLTRAVTGMPPNGTAVPAKRRGRKPHPIEEFPTPLTNVWDDPSDFAEALALHMSRHGDTLYRLHKALTQGGKIVDMSALRMWLSGAKAPRSTISLEVLARIAHRYRLPANYFRNKLPHPGRASTGLKLPGVKPAERRRLAWHLPDDFDRRPAKERAEILDWVRNVVISGATDYRRFQAAAMKQRYGLRFAGYSGGELPEASAEDDEPDLVDQDPDLATSVLPAPPLLEREMSELLAFKTSTLTQLGFQRSGVWNEETAAQKVEHLGLLFGAMAASRSGPLKGGGVQPKSLCFAMLAFPGVWDWYVQWRERRRGFYTRWECDMLRLGAALTRQETGWLRQRPEMASQLRPIAGWCSATDITAARADWGAACDAMHRHALARAKEIERVARVHRDPFEPILPILEADSPVGEYRKITEEILRLMPDARRYPRAAAEARRSFLLLRFGLHLGVRQKNLRQLLICPRGTAPTTERQLEALKRGELRWNDRASAWEVLIPSSAFKNATSTYFGGKPFRLLLPDLGDLYAHIDLYLRRDRSRLLARAKDPETFFVKTVKTNSSGAAYDQSTFYEAWRLTIQRYGVFNPYTGRGAIVGLLPHGPHNVRDVLATHILKQTGSYEQASYAIQDTPDTVARHYGRFLPQDKAALAAQVLNEVWGEEGERSRARRLELA